MKAQIKPSYDTKRKLLADIIPLSEPFTIFIEPTRYCNFKCFYCLHSTRGENDGELAKTNYELKNMDFLTYENILENIKEFPVKLKRIVFSGLGEPLMNPDLPKMIAKAKQLNIAERLDILTNASLLTPEISDALIEAGTTRIQVSLQGLNSEKYKEVSNVDVDFEKIYENLTYLYKNKGECSIFIKIIDSLLESKEDEEKFYNLFGNICDEIFIEHLITLQQQMGNHNGKADNSRNLNNEKVVYRNVCPVIFYMLQIDVDGNVFPCPVGGLPETFSMGNIKDEKLIQIWNGSKRKNLIKGHLMMNRKKIPVCSTCYACACVLDENEYLDDKAVELLNLFN
ncbi:radical SAM protein [Clostridium cylindrosporum]|uniref:Radical SAM domain protein n=1 Tax=Clostridium cylindrosporum DSM 605 TaxID=1121307 RepID=A0A0J8D9C4_CLOCY|nr:radical SAM protein [Clostridium cylindrosporum]KMT22635.1 radical SAM domain protein [Clostridium cylindrosporum DSM 605]